MRTLVIGDIHGCFTALRTLIESLELRSDDLIITLGDYIDRGMKSKEVVDYLIQLKSMYNVITLKGNHEALLDKARDTRMDRLTWTNAGGLSTLLSYEVTNPNSIPPDHLDFLLGGEKYFETDTHIFVHGGLLPDVDLEDQNEDDLFWIRIRDQKPHKSEKVIVCGHTPQRDHLIKDIGYALCIDTHVFANGWLTCLDVGSGFYWQANEAGEFRTMQLENYQS